LIFEIARIYINSCPTSLQILKRDMMEMYIDEATAFSQPSFWDFNALMNDTHDAIPTTWTTKALDLNASRVEYLCFSPKDHSIKATFRDLVTNQAIPVTREVFSAIIDSVKTQAKCK
jgi:hypothetical protein